MHCRGTGRGKHGHHLAFPAVLTLRYVQLVDPCSLSQACLAVGLDGGFHLMFGGSETLSGVIAVHRQVWHRRQLFNLWLIHSP